MPEFRTEEDKMQLGPRKKDLISCLFAALFSVVVMMGFVMPHAQATDVPIEDLMAYFDSLEDAKTATQKEIVRDLVAIVPREDAVNLKKLNGGRLQWEELPGRSRIKVATFMDWDTYNSFYKAHMDDPVYYLNKSLWVTVVPELQNHFVGNGSCPPSRDRVIKLLGLNPAKTKPYEVLVEMWAEPKDLFRPSADPEISDHEAELPTLVNGKWIFPTNLNPFTMINNKALYMEKAWQTDPPVPFTTWYVNSAKPENYDIQEYAKPDSWPMPWTRLGYTYDWGVSDNHVGLSEFILRIDPNKKGPDGKPGVARVRLIQAIDSREPASWKAYYRCKPFPKSSEGDPDALRN